MKKKFLLVAMVICMLLVMGSTYALRTDTTGLTASNNSWSSLFDARTGGSEDVNTIGQRVVGTLMVVGNIIAIVFLVILGIMYMVGSPEGKAKIKENMVPYILGAVIILSGSAILTLIQSIGGSLLPTDNG